MCVHILFHKPWHLSKVKIESHLAKTLSRWPMETKFLTKLIREMRQVLNGWDSPSAEDTEIPKVPHQEHVDNFFDFQEVVHEEFVPEGKTVNAEFYKVVMCGLLKSIQRVCPAAFGSRDIFLLHDNAPAHKAAGFRKIFDPKKRYNPLLPPRILQIYLRQTISCSPNSKLSSKDSTLRMLLRSKKPQLMN